LPAMRRVAVIWNAANPYPALVLKNIQTAARLIGIDVQSLEIRTHAPQQTTDGLQ
jgi:hypothetical protein